MGRLVAFIGNLAPVGALRTGVSFILQLSRAALPGIGREGVASSGPLPIARRLVSIRPYLHGRHFDVDAVRVMGVAFEMTRAALGLQGKLDIAPDVVAAEIIDLAEAGERDPDRLCERALLVLQR
jgi:hypothetical protein